jgi:transposase
MNRPVKSDPSRTHRRHSDDFKRSLVLQSFEPGASVARIARDNGINANQLFAWRKLHKEAQAARASIVPHAELLAVELTSPPTATPPCEAVADTGGRSGVLRLEFARARLTIEGRPDAELLRTVLGMLNR